MSIEFQKVFASAPKTVRGFPVIISGDPKGENFLYTNNKSVFIRNIEDPSICDVYTQHSYNATVAAYSPSRFYIASGDESGKVRIWDTTQAEHILKYEYHSLGGGVRDIAWSPDSKRLVVVGDGKESFGNVFLWDTGSSVGTIMGHAKPINSCTWRSTRPFRIVTASEDRTAVLHAGPPFKYANSIREHTNFVQCTRYAPNGEVFLTASADKRIIIYDGKTGEMTGELLRDDKPAHDASVYAISFNDAGNQLVSVSADKTARIWDLETQKCIETHCLGTNVEDMQLGCLWQGKHIITLALGGWFSYLDVGGDMSKPRKIVRGHNKSITCISNVNSRLYTADYMGDILSWDYSSGLSEYASGKKHANAVTSIAGNLTKSNHITSVGVDDTLRFMDANGDVYVDGKSVSLPSQPRHVQTDSNGLTVVCCINEIVLYNEANETFRQNVTFEPSRSATNTESSHLAVGAKNGHVFVYKLEGDSGFSEIHKLVVGTDVTDIAFSHDGNYLAVADASKKIVVFNTSDYSEKNVFWFHTARVCALSWHPDNVHFASGGLDTNIAVFDVNHPTRFFKVLNAHPSAHVVALSWLNESTLITVGSDCNIKHWNVKFM